MLKFKEENMAFNPNVTFLKVNKTPVTSVSVKPQGKYPTGCHRHICGRGLLQKS